MRTDTEAIEVREAHGGWKEGTGASRVVARVSGLCGRQAIQARVRPPAHASVTRIPRLSTTATVAVDMG